MVESSKPLRSALFFAKEIDIINYICVYFVLLLAFIK